MSDSASESKVAKKNSPQQKPRKAPVPGPDSESNNKSEESDTERNLTLTPEFLQPVLRQIILAGKSMEMLQALGRLGDIIDDRQTKGEGHISSQLSYLDRRLI